MYVKNVKNSLCVIVLYLVVVVCFCLNGTTMMCTGEPVIRGWGRGRVVDVPG